jgi:hypothetical protein
MLISTALLLDSIIRNSVCTPAKLPCRRVEVGYEKCKITFLILHHFKWVQTYNRLKSFFFNFIHDSRAVANGLHFHQLVNLQFSYELNMLFFVYSVERFE